MACWPVWDTPGEIRKPVFDECVIRGVRYCPGRFCAPLAGYTHSAFRRLVSELGGCGAFWTEMLAARKTVNEDFQKSPWLRRRPGDGRLVFQLMACAGDPLDRILARLGENEVEAVDLNLGCHAPNIRDQAAGTELFANFADLRKVVSEMRRHWPRILTVKIRLGRQCAGWEAGFADRMRFFEESGVDAVVVHPRFFDDKFKRRARHELLSWMRTLVRLPLIANGDFESPAQVEALSSSLQPACAVMIGRMAVARPWIFQTWEKPDAIDYLDVWRRMYRYVAEDFPPVTALRRMKMFTKYYATNFMFGHQFHTSVANAQSLEDAELRAAEFLSRSPQTVKTPSLAGL
jgi:tRNA-dihydrouridine synthase B